MQTIKSISKGPINLLLWKFHLRLCSNIEKFPPSPVEENSTTKTKKSKKELKINSDLKRHFESSNLESFLNIVPRRFLQKKHKSSEYYYIAHPATAKTISQILKKETINQQSPFVECNPGLGFLTQELINENKLNDLRLFEVNDQFIPSLEDNFESKYSNRIEIKPADFVGLWKLAFLDKIDNKNRVGRLLFGLPALEWDKGINFRLFACVGSLSFIKHLINSIAMQQSLFSMGRCELYLVMPPPLYIHLTCNNKAGYMVFRSTSYLFQIMFEHKFIARLPRKHFVPWQFEPKLLKSMKLTKINSIDSDSMYLVRIRPREDIYQKCYPENMQAMWFFIKQNCVSRKNRIIPSLEKWIPGAGARLIIQSSLESEKIVPMYPDEDVTQIPKLSTQSTTISTKNYLPNINIFTQFGDLTPSQMLTIFDQFRNWPGYNQSPFLALMENNLMKIETSIEDDVDGLELEEEPDDDAGNIDTNINEIKF